MAVPLPYRWLISSNQLNALSDEFTHLLFRNLREYRAFPSVIADEKHGPHLKIFSQETQLSQGLSNKPKTVAIGLFHSTGRG